MQVLSSGPRQQTTTTPSTRVRFSTETAGFGWRLGPTGAALTLWNLNRRQDCACRRTGRVGPWRGMFPSKPHACTGEERPTTCSSIGDNVAEALTALMKFAWAAVRLSPGPIWTVLAKSWWRTEARY